MARDIRNAVGIEPRFSSLVRRLESYAERWPFGYRMLVMGFALAGYGYFFGVIALVLAVAALAFLYLTPLAIAGSYYLIIPLFAFIGVILRSLWLHQPVPEGRTIRPDDAPRLFEMLEDVRKGTNGPAIDQVIVNGKLNAGIAQIPRLGPLGFHRNYLIIGFPMFLALTADEMRAVLAHEYGHLAGRHGRFSCWVYQLRRAWWYLSCNLQEHANWSTWLFRPFWRWFVPRFNAFSFVLARAQELEADRLALSMVGAARTGDALMRINSVEHYLGEQLWSPLFKQMDFVLQPPLRPYAKMIETFGAPLDQRYLDEGLALAFARSTDHSDTHPCLHDRLAAIGHDMHANSSREQPAVTSFLSAERVSLLAKELDDVWLRNIQDIWEARFERSCSDRKRFSELSERQESGKLLPDERIDLAGLTEKFVSAQAAIPLYESIVAENQEAGFPRFSLGRYKLEKDDDDGLRLFEEAIALDDTFLVPACCAAFVFLVRNGRDMEAETYRRRAAEHRNRLEEAAFERGMPRLSDRLIPHGENRAVLEPLVRELVKYNDIQRVYLVRRRCRVLPDRPSYVLLVMTYPSVKCVDYELVENVASEVRLRGDTYVVLWTARTWWLEIRANRIPGALILSR